MSTGAGGCEPHVPARGGQVRWARRFVGLVAGLLLVAGCGGGDGGAAQPYKEPTGPAKETLKIEAGNFYFEPDKPDAKSEVVNLELDGAEGAHTLVFDGGKVPGFQLEVDAGNTASKKIDLKPGKYTFYCDIIGHREQGMEGTLTIK